MNFVFGLEAACFFSLLLRTKLKDFWTQGECFSYQNPFKQDQILQHNIALHFYNGYLLPPVKCFSDKKLKVKIQLLLYC